MEQEPGLDSPIYCLHALKNNQSAMDLSYIILSQTNCNLPQNKQQPAIIKLQGPSIWAEAQLTVKKL